MNRAKSITDIGDIYREMQRVRAAKNLNESVITEAAKVKAKMPKDTFPKSSDVVKEPSTLKKGGPQNVKGLNKAKKNKKFSQKSKKIVKEDINSFMSIFDRLYEDVMNNDELDINTGIGMGPEGDAGDDSLDLDTDSDSDLGGDEVTITLDKELAKKLLDVLKDVVGEDEGDMSDSDTDLEDLGVDTEDEGDDEDEDNEGFYETTDIQKLPDAAGHKLTKGMDAAGNIKKSSGKADARVTDTVGIETGKHPMDHKSELTNPSKNKVGSLKAGKSLFDQ